MAMKIFLYEPDESAGSPLAARLRNEGYDVTWIKDFFDAERKLEHDNYNASLIEISCHKDFGMQLIKEWFKYSHAPLCVSIYAQEDTAAGFKTSRLGSQEIYELTNGNTDILDNILRKYKVYARVPQEFLHRSKAYQKAVVDLRNLINHHQPVLLTGESGSGKSYLAEHIHKNGTQSNFRYEEVRCDKLDAADSVEKLLGVARGFRADVKRDRLGLLDSAREKGLLYLEKINLLTPELQDIIADVLEKGYYRAVGGTVEKTFNANVIASCQDISEIRHPGFNHRLYVLISHNIVKVPPLRECTDDIIPTAKQIIEDYCVEQNIEPAPTLEVGAQIYLYTHEWPGNYRELKSCIESAVSRCTDGVIKAEDLNITLMEGENEPPKDKRGMIIFYLTKFGGNKSAAAKAMKTTRPTLDTWLADFGIDYKMFKRQRDPAKRKRKQE